ncbi:MAG TPA: hypothetical protein VK050_03075 [Flavobacteriaceae bacterium]|nr:hypothetical protein [Flavobacteriaceae bacterium]
MKTINELIYQEKKAYHIRIKKILDIKLEDKLSNEFGRLLVSVIPKSDADYAIVTVVDQSGYFFVSENAIAQILNFLIENKVLLSYKEITTDVLLGSLHTEDFKKTFIEDDEFTYVLEKFILDNLTVDMVLDKISEKGIDSLREIDYQVLEAHSSK